MTSKEGEAPKYIKMIYAFSKCSDVLDCRPACETATQLPRIIWVRQSFRNFNFQLSVLAIAGPRDMCKIMCPTKL